MEPRRLQKEREFHLCFQDKVFLHDTNDDQHWRASIVGPTGTPYAGGLFEVEITIPVRFPFEPPAIRFVTRVFHTSIAEDGTIDFDLLFGGWSPAYTISGALSHLRALMCMVNSEGRGEAVQKFNSDRVDFWKTAHAGAREFAHAPPCWTCDDRQDLHTPVRSVRLIIMDCKMRAFDVEASADTLISELKGRACQLTRTPYDQTTMIGDGHPLAEDKTLGYYGFANGDMIYAGWSSNAWAQFNFYDAMKLWTVVLTLDAIPIASRPDAIDVRATLISGTVVTVSTTASTELGKLRMELAKVVGLPPQNLKLVTPGGQFFDEDSISVAILLASELKANISSALLGNGGAELASNSAGGSIVPASSTSLMPAEGRARYFLRGTLLPSSTGAMIFVEHLEVGNFVLAVSGAVLRVMKAQLHEAAPTAFWDRAFDTGGGQQTLVDMPFADGTTDFYELVFCPDEPVEACGQPSTKVLSWGQLSTAFGHMLSFAR